MISTHSRHYIYTHWLKMDSTKELIQWKNLKEFMDKYDCAMTVYYYDYNPLTDKVVKLDCNQPYKDLDLDVNSSFEGSFKKINAKPKNITAYNKGIDYFFEKKLGIKINIERGKKINNSNIDIESFIKVNALEEFEELENIKEFDKIMKQENWSIVKIKSDRQYHYQLYFGEGIQVDNRYEFAFNKFIYKSVFKDRLQRFINNTVKQKEVNLSKFIGLKINSFESIYQFSDGENISTDIKCIGLVLGINDNYLDLYDFKKPLGHQFYSIKIDDFKKFVLDGLYKENYNILTAYEKLELQRYLNKKIEKFQQICGDWDYRNIDMTESHLQGISIKDGVITTSCEKFSVDLDDYISCNSGDMKNKDLIDKFNLLDLTKKEQVLEYISEVESKINFSKVDKKLYEAEQNELKKMNSEDIEMEMEYE